MELASFLSNHVILDLTVNNGWKIYTHVGKVPHNEIPDLKRKIKGWFDKGEWAYEDNHRILVYNQTINSQVEVILKEKTTDQEKAMGLNKYGIVIESVFFGLRNDIFIDNCVIRFHIKLHGKNRLVI